MTRLAKRLRSALLTVLLSTLCWPGVLGLKAQTPEEGEAVGAAPGPQAEAVLAREDLEALLLTLEDPLAREAMAQRLRTLIALQAPEQAVEEPNLGASLIDAASARIEAFSRRLEGLLVQLEQAPASLRSGFAALGQREVQTMLLEICAKILGIGLLALAGAWLCRRLLARPLGELQARRPLSAFNRLLLLLFSLVLKLIPVVIFLALAYLLLPLVEPREVTRVVLLTLVHAHALAQALIILVRGLLAVETPALRPYRLDDHAAAYAYVWIRRLIVVVVYGYFLAQALLLLGLDASVHGMLVDLTGLLVALMLVSLVLQNRQPVASAIRGGPAVSGIMAQLRGTAAMLWHVLAIAYIVGLYIVWAFTIAGGFAYLLRSTLLTLLIGFLLRLALGASERGLRRLFHIPEHLQAQYPGLEERANRYRPLITAAAKAVILALGLLAILEAWGVNATGFLLTDLGRELLARLLRIGLIFAVSILVWEFLSALIERRLKAQARASRRILTLLPLAKNLLRLFIVVLAGMIALSEIGVNIGPLLASAGVVGLAIGFGAQTLVRDLITGAFVILEDIIGVGDWVEVGGHNGMVEAMTIRTLRLRDLQGNLRIIPFGEVSSVHKVAGDYSHALIVIGVAYRENTDEVVQVLVQLGEELRRDEVWGPRILDALEVQGVTELNSSSVDIRVRLKCRPLEQWGVRREFLRRVKLRFDELGIEIPFPHQTLYFGEDKQGGAAPARVLLSEAKAGDQGQGALDRSRS